MIKHTPFEVGAIHFIGIGGIGMSGIAEILVSLGYRVRGSDIAENANVKRLREKGVTVHIGQDAKNLQTIDDAPLTAVVISSAIKDDNPELVAARKQKLAIVRRADMLAELMRRKWTIAISGTHGKTTTTTMVGAMLETGGVDPTVVNGGIVNSYGTNTRMGQGEWVVAEADESDGSFTRLPATVAVVTNIDPEHMDHYKDFDEMRYAYRTFVENIPYFGFAVVCSDHHEVQNLIAQITDRRIIAYGFNPQADVQATNLRMSAEGSTFDVVFKATKKGDETLEVKDFFLPMPGQHNVLNALSALAIAKEMNIAVPLMKKSLSEFSGVRRRFTKTGEVNGISIIDDYGHHPVEITAVLKAARQVVDQKGGKVIAVMQPHRYSRLHDLFEDFCTSFNDADTVYISDVYAAGENLIEGATRETLTEGIQKHGHKDANILTSPDNLAVEIADKAREGDLVICLGAGNITTWANALPKQLEAEFAARQKNRA